MTDKIEVEHDGDGKIYYVDDKDQIHWVVEVEISNGDKVRDAINNLLDQNFKEGDKEEETKICGFLQCVNPNLRVFKGCSDQCKYYRTTN